MSALTIDKPRIRDSKFVKSYFCLSVVGICISLFLVCVYPYTYDHENTSTAEAKLGQIGWRTSLVQLIADVPKLLADMATISYSSLLMLKMMVVRSSAKKITLIVEYDLESKSNGMKDKVVDVKEEFPTWSAFMAAGGPLAALVFISDYTSIVGKETGWSFQ
ncbi:unnamed protein product [Kuraishia capsulata CBS 1993]|uniref:Uncharacterized protein n=1 Tax=Kuraishia capsulata CBS 1993 TaxID=1382522 RepID=W6MHH2_9ASCO|nr:uncharacterized protein KUCA_T00001679001 [Kuraishia capsulata CBS 1993]CDK25709.1 unnamed protein product [Kuraishia capsulata CBS 1993]